MSITLPQAAFTIHTVVKLDDWSNATSETIWECYGNFINYVRLEKVSGTLKVTALFNGTTREASTTISYSGYYFITCIIREGSTDGIQVFVNDSEQSYDDVDNRDSTGLTFSGDLIGCYLGKGKSNPNNPLDGKIDQLIPFSKALTSTEVSTLYNSGDGLQYKDLDSTETFYGNIVAWYDFNRPDAFGQDYHTGGLDLTPVSITSSNAVLGHIEGKAAGYDGVTKWLDRSGNGNNATQGTITAIPTWLENQLNTTEDVVSFDGGTSAQWLDLPTNDGYMDGVTDNPFTWCFLFNMSALANNNFLLGAYANPPLGWYYYINSSGILIARDYDASNNGIKSFSLSGFSANTWYYLTIAYSSSNGFTVYRNAIDQSVTTSTAGAYVAMEDLYVRLGNYLGSSTNTFRGQMGQVMYFQKELTQADVSLIKDYYNEKYNLSL
jgi:hypothetical protein